jgi:hypothetical protein
MPGALLDGFDLVVIFGGDHGGKERPSPTTGDGGKRKRPNCDQRPSARSRPKSRFA